MAGSFVSYARRVLASLFAGAALGGFVALATLQFFPKYERHVFGEWPTTFVEWEEAKQEFAVKVFATTSAVVLVVGMTFGGLRLGFGPTAKFMAVGATTGVIVAVVASRIAVRSVAQPSLIAKTPVETLYSEHLIIGVPVAAMLGASIGFLAVVSRSLLCRVSKRAGTE